MKIKNFFGFLKRDDIMIQFIGLGILAFGVYKLGEYNDKKRKEENEKYLEEKREEQKKIWNNGFCPQCGKRWKYHWYYPSGSRGEYQYLNIKCHRCRKESDLWAYIPDEVEPPYEHI